MDSHHYLGVLEVRLYISYVGLNLVDWYRTKLSPTFTEKIKFSFWYFFAKRLIVFWKSYLPFVGLRCAPRQPTNFINHSANPTLPPVDYSFQYAPL